MMNDIGQKTFELRKETNVRTLIEVVIEWIYAAS